MFAVDVGSNGPAFVAPVGEAHFGPADEACGDAEGEKKDPEEAGVTGVIGVEGGGVGGGRLGGAPPTTGDD